MKTDEIREKFLNFFKSKGHKIVSSDSLIPKGDPTLLFTGAGMNQFKDQFMGKNITFTRAASCQKCLRTDDLEKVGHTPGHHTFFEMLGNFSFGDYFKDDAIKWAWEFLTEVLSIPKSKLKVSVYRDDEQAFNIWKDKIGLSEKKIVKLGIKENFWPANVKEEGPNGPCGPCSEIFYDQGEDVGCGRAECDVDCGCNRFVEVWNLVFTQFDRKDTGVLEPLPFMNIDTGMGLERLASVLQRVSTNFEIDIFKPIVEAIKKLAPSSKLQAPSSIYAIADHIRAIVFAIGDGILPSNDDRGYVIRKLIRKATGHTRQVGIKEIFLYKLAPVVIEVMKNSYPELKTNQDVIIKTIHFEEERFFNTLIEGMQILEEKIINLKDKGEYILSGEDAFQLTSTFGIPLELTEEIARSKSVQVDRNGFKLAMMKQQQQSKQKTHIKEGIFVSNKYNLSHLPETVFEGYKKFTTNSKILAILKNRKLEKSASSGYEVLVILDRTPFYAEAGGQVGDTGKLVNENAEVNIKDTQLQDKYILHKAELKMGKINVGDMVEAIIDISRRLDIARNHTATHLLQAALRKIIGAHIRQAGSLVTYDRLRFDFTHFKSIDFSQLKQIENEVNNAILEDLKIDVKIMDFDQSRKSGALAFFGEKYEDKVRVIEIGDFSKELCGGTHLERTSQVVLFKLISESSIASGVRRIEAVTGRYAYRFLTQKEEVVNRLENLLNVKYENIVEEVQNLTIRTKNAEARLKQIKLKIWKDKLEHIIKKANIINNIKVITLKEEQEDIETLRLIVDIFKPELHSGILAIGSTTKESSCILVCYISSDLVKAGLNASELVKEVSKIINGGGGGKPWLAEAGGRNPAGLNKALEEIKRLVKIKSESLLKNK